MSETDNRIIIPIEEEMRSSYLDYAMSVIIGRALPDVRDGLKPVHRRVLYAMHDMGLVHEKPHKKAARVVGDVIGKYHPHGDQAAYDTIVRMVQDFSLRYPLIDGQGNFGSVDGDSAAAMRYTEVRLSAIAAEMLADLDKDTVDFAPNYDDSMTEPKVLPSRLPGLLVNGSQGIAVGMATSIPPHNLAEVVDATTLLIDDPEVSDEALMGKILGPDFPTAGMIYGTAGIRQAYLTGRGIVQVRGKALIETDKRTGRESIIVSEIPYMVGKGKIIEKIVELAREKKVEGISDLRDESDRQGMRLVIEVKRDADARVVLNHLYKNTSLQTSFGIILLALVNNRPKLLTLRDILREFIEYRKEIVVRRTRFLLAKAEAEAHILEGLIVALDHLDEIIALIKGSATPAEAREGLIRTYGLSELQAKAILEMRLSRLTGLERDKIKADYEALIRDINRYREILANAKLVLQIIKEELAEVRAKYGDARRTAIIPETEEISIEDLIVEEDVVVTISHGGYVKRNPVSLYRSQRRGGKGVVGMGTKQEDFVTDIFVASTHDYLLVFTNRGRVHWLKVYQIPEVGRSARGKAIINLIAAEPGEVPAAMLPVKNFEDGKYVFLATAKGIVKKTALVAYSHVKAIGIRAVELDEGDALIGVALTDGERDILLATKKGKAIRFAEKLVRPTGRVTRGVTGIKMIRGDELVAMEVLYPGSTVLTATEYGFGKRTNEKDFPRKGRAGMGVLSIKTSARNGLVVGLMQVRDEDEVVLISTEGKVIRMKAGEIQTYGRNTAGVRLLDLGTEDRLVGMARFQEREEEEGE
jgi:DNA gyrase subunit A